MQSVPISSRSRIILLALSMGCLASLPGCAGLVVTGGGVTGVAAAQERSLERGAKDIAIASELRSMYLQTQFDELFLSVSVLVVEGRILLTGTVDTEDIRTKAFELATQTEGAEQVMNEIQVAPGYGMTTRLNDTWISTEIRARLLAALGADQIDFWTTTHDSVVYLVGIAENEAEVQQVTDVARNVKGVKKVVNYIILRDDPRRLPATDG
ncbi:MAG: BON domain-containing protein [Alphaproteobacteria bacterium]|nr:BON domain-containing protein [Alphaproteobacteria bacterium]